MASKAALRVSGLLAETICTFICMSTWPKSAVKHERLFMQDPSVYSWQPAIACGLCTALSSGSDGFRQHELALQHASQEMPLRLLWCIVCLVQQATAALSSSLLAHDACRVVAMSQAAV